MAIVDLIMPKMGESIMEATILKWHKNVGDHIQQDETLLDIATDKVDSEVPSTVDGILKEILFEVNDVVPVGSVIAKIETAVAAAITPNVPKLPTETATVVVTVPEQIHHAPTTPQPEEIEPPFLGEMPYVPQNITTSSAKNNNSFFSPSVLSIANSEGISLSELEKIKGTGEDGRVTKKDILEYAPENSGSQKQTGNNRFYSPLVLNIANSEGISLAELERIEGTGADGRVSKRDVLQYVANKKAGLIPAYVVPTAPAPIVSQPVVVPEPVVTVQPPVIHSEPAPVVSTQPIVIPEPVVVPAQAAFTAPTVEPVIMPQQPVVAAPVVPEPIVTVPEPVVTVPEPVVTVPKPVVTVPEPVVTVPEPVVTVPKPVVTVPEPIVTVPEPVVTVPEPVVTVPKPVVTVPEPIVTVPEPVVTVPEPVVTVPEPVVTVPEPVVTVPEPVVTVPEPVVTVAEKVVEHKSVVATSINQTCLQPVQQSVFVPTPVYIKDIPLSTLAEGHSGKFANPTSVLPTGDTEIIEMDRMRKLIAKHMVNSVQTSPHVTSFVEADVTNMVLWRNRVKEEFERREGTKITFTPMFIESIVKVMQQFPLINSSIEGEKIVVKKDFNIGMATALPSGNLIVPVIKSAEKLNIVGLSKAVNNLANAARNSQLKPDDTTGGTFTVTNIGTFGSLMGTPIINQPQVAILAIGAIKKKPVVIESEDGDTIGIRHMMYLSLSYDHRVIDGSVGASFLTAVAKELEQWDVNRTWYQYL
ncbi:2-oxo acid dehydrogenase subunit E2 [Parasediminibacterium paludis]|uniref:Dihydrolipoamide acetyltransferase component of pyruvate dehydrogenase complex n=1 Tax=Parasediminibacterium paludis TaxID=908966 RepID=A0ABV8PRZ0_9BACT